MDALVKRTIIYRYDADKPRNTRATLVFESKVKCVRYNKGTKLYTANCCALEDWTICAGYVAVLDLGWTCQWLKNDINFGVKNGTSSVLLE